MVNMVRKMGKDREEKRAASFAVDAHPDIFTSGNCFETGITGGMCLVLSDAGMPKRSNLHNDKTGWRDMSHDATMPEQNRTHMQNSPEVGRYERPDMSDAGRAGNVSESDGLAKDCEAGMI